MNKDKQNITLFKLLLDFLNQNLDKKLMPPEQNTGHWQGWILHYLLWTLCNNTYCYGAVAEFCPHFVLFFHWHRQTSSISYRKSLSQRRLGRQFSGNFYWLVVSVALQCSLNLHLLNTKIKRVINCFYKANIFSESRILLDTFSFSWRLYFPKVLVFHRNSFHSSSLYALAYSRGLKKIQIYFLAL